MVGKFLIKVLICFLFIQMGCKNSIENNDKVAQIPIDCLGDSLQRRVIFIQSNLDNVNEIVLEQYLKGSAFKKFLKSEKRSIFKGYGKRQKEWHFSCFEYLNINYDYLFIVPFKTDSDFYYVTNMKLIYQKYTDSYYSCKIEYRVNFLNKSERFELMNPSKIRNLPGTIR